MQKTSRRRPLVRIETPFYVHFKASSRLAFQTGTS